MKMLCRYVRRGVLEHKGLILILFYRQFIAANITMSKVTNRRHGGGGTMWTDGQGLSTSINQYIDAMNHWLANCVSRLLCISVHCYLVAVPRTSMSHVPQLGWYMVCMLSVCMCVVI